METALLIVAFGLLALLARRAPMVVLLLVALTGGGVQKGFLPVRVPAVERVAADVRGWQDGVASQYVCYGRAVSGARAACAR